MSPIRSRRTLLLAESELNRRQLAAEWSALAAGSRALTAQAGSLATIAGSGARLLAGLVALRQGAPPPAAGPAPGWLGTLLSAVGTASSLWAALRPR